MKKLIAHPLFVGIFCLLLGALINEIVKRNSAPIAKIVPSQITVNSAENISFEAKDSSDPDGDDLNFKWTVAGNSFNSSSVAFCQLYNPTQLNCSFSSPGTHIVSVQVTDKYNSSATASSSVKVTIPGGYIGFIIQYGVKEKDLDLIRAVNFSIDWVKIQSLLRGKPVVIYDPDSSSAVFAINIKRSISKAKKYINNLKTIDGLKILAPPNPEIITQIKDNLAEVGINVSFASMPGGEVYLALERGLSNSGFLSISNENDLMNYYK